MFERMKKGYNIYVMKKLIFFLIFILVFITLPLNKSEAVKLNYYINDYSSVLDYKQQKNLNRILSNYDKESTVQLVGVIIDSLKGEDISSYSMRVFNENGIGQKYVNNGALIVVALKDKRVRVNLGYGLEWPVSDTKAKLLINEMLPLFKSGKYYDALLKGFNRLIELTKDLSWEVKYVDIKQVKKDEKEAIGKVVSFKAKLKKAYGNFIVVITPEGYELVINTTVNMKSLIQKIRGNKDYSIVTARFMKTKPLTFNLLGVNYDKEE